MTVKRPTGSELPDLFGDEAIEWTSYASAVDAFREASHVKPWNALKSATVAMHVRDGIALSGLVSGIVTGGTASELYGELPAARGCVQILDFGRITEDGVRRSVSTAEDHEAGPAEPFFAIFHEAGRVRVKVPEYVMLFTPDAPPAEPIETGYAYADPEPESELVRMAREMSDVPAAVSVERPDVPALSDRPVENVRRLFALTVSQLADLFGITERQMHRYLREGLPESRRQRADALVAVGLTVIGGLGAEGARRWLYSGEPTAAELARQGRITELAERAEALRDSPAT